MTSGPRELAIYHAQVLESERQPKQPKGIAMTEEIDLEAANERLAHMGIMPPTAEDQPEKFRTVDPLQENAHAMLEASKYVVSYDDLGLKTRKKRADAGKPRAPKPKPPAVESVPASAPVGSGVLTREQANDLYELAVAINTAAEEERLQLADYQEAVIKSQHAKDALRDRLKSLTTHAA